MILFSFDRCFLVEPMSSVILMYNVRKDESMEIELLKGTLHFLLLYLTANVLYLLFLVSVFANWISLVFFGS